MKKGEMTIEEVIKLVLIATTIIIVLSIFWLVWKSNTLHRGLWI